MKAGQREAWQQERRWEIARFHAARNPAYRALVPGGLPARWEALPIVTKALFQRPLLESLSDGYAPETLHRSSTSGSSGEPFFFARDKYTHARTWALIAQRYGWHGIRLGSRQARFYGIPLEFWPRVREVAKDRMMNRARFSVFDLSDARLEGFRKRIERVDSSICTATRTPCWSLPDISWRIGATLKAGCPTLRTCIVTSEMCTAADRRVLQEAFGVPIVNEYGASEIGIVAVEMPRETGGSPGRTCSSKRWTRRGAPSPTGRPGRSS